MENFSLVSDDNPIPVIDSTISPRIVVPTGLMVTGDSLSYVRDWGPSSFIRYGHIVRRFAPTLCQGLRIHSTAHFSQSGAVISGTGSEIWISMTIFAWHKNMNFATCAVLMYDGMGASLERLCSKKRQGKVDRWT